MPEQEEKFLDIAPPHKINTEGLKMRRPQREKKSFLWLKKLLLPLCLLLLIVGAFFSFQSRRVEIKIWPETQTIKLEKEITFKEGAIADFSTLTLPLSILEVEEEKSQKFPASYVAQERKAEGTIRVYNLYSTTPLSLVARTRFLSEEGKLFRTTKKITIPGKKLEGGKWVPGTLDVQVVAAEPGEDYNIPPSHFSLPGLAGTNLYTLVYGESKEPMRGGFSGQGRQVLKEDIETAKDVLKKKLAEENEAALQRKAEAQEKILLKENILHKITATSLSAERGAAVEEFSCKVKLKSQAFALPKETLEKLAKEVIESNLEKGKIFWEKTLNLDWKVQDQDWEAREVKILLEISAKTSEKIEKPALLDSLAGKSIREALFLLKNQFPQAEIESTPFWLNKIPNDLNKINLEIEL